jgi:CYTH domain-containing protein
MEIERKWLVDPARVNELKKLSYTHFKIEQYYLSDKDDSWTIRLRKQERDCSITLKSKGLLSREEIELDITKIEFAEYVKFAKTKIIKTRYHFENNEVDKTNKYPHYVYEIDVYNDYDFVTCELEFDTEEEAKSFIPPDWCIKDVTADPYYKNVNLAK